MKCSLILTTYNWKEALKLSLTSALDQSHKPSEIIIADDGSRDDTRDLITKFQNSSDIPIIHVWQEDRGFRLAKIRNEAIKRCSYEYIIFSDGDMVLHPHFVKDHLNCAKKGTYIQGSRVLMGQRYTNKIFQAGHFIKPSFFSNDIKNRKNSLYLPLLSKLICKLQFQKLKSVRGCNFSLFKDDIYSVNGFNEEFNSWGREDSEFVQRLFNKGFYRVNLKFAAIQYHLYHKSSTVLDKNDELLDRAINEKTTWCEKGLISK